MTCGGCFDASRVVLELRFGIGGEDSKIFVGELFSAYTKYAQSKNLKVELIDSDPGHIVAEIEGKDAFRTFRHETGQHCCQRVPETERSGRRQTSFISVAVLPVRPVRPEESSSLNMAECDISHERGKLSAGGQNAQRNAVAIKATHKPTGISVFIQNERSQEQNRKQAIRILASRVADAKRAASDTEYRDFKRKALGDGNRGSKIRTYQFIDQRVTDHRNGKKDSEHQRGDAGPVRPAHGA